MKKSAFALIVAALAACSAPSFAADKPVDEANLFVNPIVAGDATSEDMKGIEKLLIEEFNSEDGEDAAKCCYWGYTYYYPTYHRHYYYSWYCPVYYCHFRMVYYTVPAYTVCYTMSEDGNEAQEILETKGGMRTARGAVVAGKVAKNSLLAKAGIKPGDIVTAVDGTPVNDISDLKRINKRSRIKYIKGDKIKIADKLASAGSKKVSNGFKTDMPAVDLQDEGVQGAGMTLREFFENEN